MFVLALPSFFVFQVHMLVCFIVFDCQSQCFPDSASDCLERLVSKMTCVEWDVKS